MKLKASIDNKGTHNICPVCHGENITVYQKEGREYYRCNICDYDENRLIVIYPQMRYRLLEDEEILHYSVGAIIEWQGKYLLFHRRLFPFQYTIIAGHWDLSDATPEEAVMREIQEEAGINITVSSLPLIETLKEPCRRGADYHEWRLYQESVDDHKVTLSEEADIIGWYSSDEIRSLELTVPTEYFLKKFKII